MDAGYTGEGGQYLKDKLNDRLPGLGDKFCDGLSALCNRGRLNVPIHLEYDLRGVGTTLSVGYKEFFASVTGTYSQTRLKGLMIGVTALLPFNRCLVISWSTTVPSSLSVLNIKAWTLVWMAE